MPKLYKGGLFDPAPQQKYAIKKGTGTRTPVILSTPSAVAQGETIYVPDSWTDKDK